VVWRLRSTVAQALLPLVRGLLVRLDEQCRPNVAVSKARHLRDGDRAAVLLGAGLGLIQPMCCGWNNSGRVGTTVGAARTRLSACVRIAECAL
jgi:hypothetical protein